MCLRIFDKEFKLRKEEKDEETVVPTLDGSHGLRQVGWNYCVHPNAQTRTVVITPSPSNTHYEQNVSILKSQSESYWNGGSATSS